MAIRSSQQKAVAKYNGANYDRVELRLPKGRKAEVERHAQEVGETINGYVNNLIRDDMGISENDWGYDVNMKTLNQLRRVLKDHGYELRKRDRGQDSWIIADPQNNSVVAGGGVVGLTMDEVSEWVDDMLKG